MLLKKGDEAPDFALRDQNGGTVKLSDHRGRKVLLYFYPKANTSG
jgi:thioredoxin-dependent peroxiredoxin